MNQSFRYNLVIIIFMFTACNAPLKMSRQRTNLSDTYNPGSSRLHPAYTVYHESVTRSVLFAKYFPSELLFSQANVSGEFEAKLDVLLEVYEITDRGKAELVDSSSFNYRLNRDVASKPFITRMYFRADTGKLYELRIRAVDKIRRHKNVKYMMVDKMTIFSQQNFMVKDKEGTPLFSPYVVNNSLFTIDHRESLFNKLYVSYYSEDLPLPQPTFSPASEDSYYQRPDSIWVLPYSREKAYQLSYEGMYFFRFDTTVQGGLSVFNYGESFPKVEAPRDLAEPLAYITTSVQYQEIINSGNLKLAVDNFWLDIAGSPEKARELIRVYYNRVYFANYYFTSNKPGWKTDRGMIYIVYGPPDNLWRARGTEEWIYYRKGNSSSVTFTFNYKYSPYTVNNFILQRSDSYDWHWREAVDAWRNGNVSVF